MIRLAGVVASGLVSAGVLVGFALSSAIAHQLPHSTWFTAVFAAAVVGFLFFLDWLRRRYLS